MDFIEYLYKKSAEIEVELKKLMFEKNPSPIVSEAMEYSLFCGGKRLRPILSLMAGEMFGGDEKDILPYACTIEMIHTYSLIHDDLPGMDNDDFRRGKLSNHKVYGEGFAILAGDALLNKAFEIMLDMIIEKKEHRFIKAAKEIGNASGLNGMIGGQAIDLFSENRDIDKSTLEKMHEKKTGALICASLNIGTILSNASEKDYETINHYGKLIGKAFQITDDILDVTSTVEKLGKPIGSDNEKHKSTYVTFYGLEKSKLIAEDLISEAKGLISGYDKNYYLLKLADYIINRDK